MVASTVIITGRIRWIPASGRACSKGFPFACISSIKSNSTNTYTYDTLNRLTTLANSWAGSFGFTYDALSRRTQMTRPNKLTTNYSYDNLSHLLSVLHQLSGSTIDGGGWPGPTHVCF
jgi:YD repeat-containing protein